MKKYLIIILLGGIIISCKAPQISSNKPAIKVPNNYSLGSKVDSSSAKINWKEYFKDENLYEATVENLTDHIPLDNENYSSSMLATRTNKVSEFFNQGPIQIKLDENNIITFNIPIHYQPVEVLYPIFE